MPTFTQALTASVAARPAVAASAPPAKMRLPLLDAAKGLACMLIVWHHLAFYGPMSDVAHPLAPRLIDWLYDYGRFAVQVFLAIGGFLAAGALAPRGQAAFEQPWPLIGKRYERLARPYLAALAVTLVVSALVRPWLSDASVPSAPSLWQIVVHAFLLQDLLGQEALSAGVWYVAIDFQLFVLAVGLFHFARQWESRWPLRWLAPGVVLVLGVAVGSLAYFNRHAALDVTALYFAGSYALGMLAYWASRAKRPLAWGVLLFALGAAALLLDFRGRILTSWTTALVLAWVPRQAWSARWPSWAWLQRVGAMSYSVFLIHFPVCLLVNAVFGHLWPTLPWMNAFGMLLAFTLSLAAGRLLHEQVEAARATQPRLLPLLRRVWPGGQLPDALRQRS